MIKGEGPAEEEGPRRILPWVNHLPAVMIQGWPLATVLQPSTLYPGLHMLRSPSPWGDMWKGYAEESPKRPHWHFLFVDKNQHAMPWANRTCAEETY